MSPDDIAIKHLGHRSRMISGSKSMYMMRYPKNKPLFNASVFNSEAIQIWWGDLDLTVDEPKLKALAKELNETIYAAGEGFSRRLEMTVKLLEDESKLKYPQAYRFAP